MIVTMCVVIKAAVGMEIHLGIPIIVIILFFKEKATNATYDKYMYIEQIGVEKIET